MVSVTNQMVSLYSGTSVFDQKLSWKCFSSRSDFGTGLTAKHVMNAYLSKNNNKEYGSIYFV